MKPRSVFVYLGIIGAAVCLFCAACFLFGCARPLKAPAAIAPAALPAVAVARCPDGYQALIAHEALRGPVAGHGSVTVPYVAHGKKMQLVCTAATPAEDPRRNRPVSGAIPDSESTKKESK